MMRMLFRSTALFFLLWSVQIQAATTLTLAHIVVPEHPRAKACQYFAETVKKLSQGRLLVEVYGNASLGDAASNLRALQNGTLDMTANTQGPVSAIVPEFNAFGMPFLFADSAAAWRVLDGPAGQQLAKISAAKGLIVLGLWDNGVRHFSNNVRPLLKPADFVGLKIRTPPDPVTMDIVEALGAKTQQINFSDLYNALRLGVVDGQENPLINVKEAKLYEFQKFFSLTGHKYEITPFLMGQRSWDTLSLADREIVLQAAKEATQIQRALTQKADLEAYNTMLARGVRIDKVDSKPFVAATAKIYDKWYASPIGDFVRLVVQAAREKP
ncbi:MAG: TRAP transporter substrate-binding protein [Betaproteobacteria bacterium]